jgi:hypothetical protein
LFNPEYNVLKVAGSSAGRIHSEETHLKLRKARLERAYVGADNPMFGKTHNEETRKKK